MRPLPFLIAAATAFTTFTVVAPVAQAAGGPTVSITSPANGAQVSPGPFAVNVEADADPDALVPANPVSIAVTMNGTLVDTVPCSVLAIHCGGTVTPTAPSGNGTSLALVATVTMTDASTTDSPTVTVTVNNPPPPPVDPAVVINSVTGPSSGIYTITLTGTTNSASTTTPTALGITTTAGTVSGNLTCGAGHSCTKSFTFNSAGLNDGTVTITPQIFIGATPTTGPTQDITITNAVNPQITAFNIGSPTNGVYPVSVTGTTDAASNTTPTALDISTTAGAVSASQTCGSGHSCTKSFTFNSAGLSDGTVTITPRIFIGATPTNGISPQNITITNPADPDASVLSPSAGAQVSGTVTVTVFGQNANPLASSQPPQSVDVAITRDGVVVRNTPAINCSRDSLQCTKDFQFDTTGLADGPLVLTPSVTINGQDYPQASRTIQVRTLPATIVIITPKLAEGASGNTVSVSGSIDPSVSIGIANIRLFSLQNGQRLPIATAACNAAKKCTATAVWRPTSLTGTVSLGAEMDLTTSTGTTVFGSKSAAQVRNKSTVTATVAFRGKITNQQLVLSGRVLDINGVGIAGRTVKVTSALVTGGAKRISSKVTDSNGNWRVTAPIKAARVIKIDVPEASTGYATTSKLKARTTTQYRCTQPSAARRGAVLTGFCVLSVVPKNTGMTLQLFNQGAWRTVATGRTKGSESRFRVSFSRPGIFKIRVLVASNAAYLKSSSQIMKVRVR